MEKIVERTMLYDFYGDLLTEHQKTVYECIVFQDMSLGETAEMMGISRQGVHDLVKRCDRLLAEYESKLHLVRRFLGLRSSVGVLMEKINEYADRTGEPLPDDITALSARIREEI